MRGAVKLATTLAEHQDEAKLFKLLATLRYDADVGAVDSWRWTGPADDFARLVRAARRVAHDGPGRAARRVEELSVTMSTEASTPDRTSAVTVSSPAPR